MASAIPIEVQCLHVLTTYIMTPPLNHPVNRARPNWNTHTAQPRWNEATERKHPMNRARPYWNTHTAHRARPYWNTHTAQPRWNEANEATEGKPWYWNTYLDGAYEDDDPEGHWQAATEGYWNPHLDGADDAVPKTEGHWQAATEGYWGGDSWGSTNQYLDFWNEEDRKGEKGMLHVKSPRNGCGQIQIYSGFCCLENTNRVNG